MLSRDVGAVQPSRARTQHRTWGMTSTGTDTGPGWLLDTGTCPSHQGVLGDSWDHPFPPNNENSSLP